MSGQCPAERANGRASWERTLGRCFSCDGGALGSGLRGPRRYPSSDPIPYPPPHRPCVSSPLPGTSAQGLPRAWFALGFLAGLPWCLEERDTRGCSRRKGRDFQEVAVCRIQLLLRSRVPWNAQLLSAALGKSGPGAGRGVGREDYRARFQWRHGPREAHQWEARALNCIPSSQAEKNSCWS